MQQEPSAPSGPEAGQGNARFEQDRKLLVIMYALMGAALFVPPTAVASVIMAHVKQGQLATPMLETHASWLIRTFWWTLFWFVIGSVLAIVLIGYLVLGIAWIWLAYRVIKGSLQLWDGVAV